MEPKNLLFILSDEHTREITGCYGHDLIRTPHLDRLAARGSRFDNAYTNCPICVPARASLATGRYVHQIRLWDNAHPYCGEPRGWGHRLMDAGSHVTAIGKLHYRSAQDPTGWSEEIDTLHVVDGVGDLKGCIRQDMQERSSASNLASEAGRSESTYTRYDARTADNAITWLRREAAQQRDQPWMLFLGFVLPHFPLKAPPEFYDLYPDLPEPRLYAQEERPTHPVLQAMSRVSAYDNYFDPEKVKIARRAYFGMVSYLDHCIGRVLEALEACGLADDTRIIYTSDHGDNIGHRGLWGKSNMYEESAAVPLILAGPDVPQGHTVSTPASLVDCYQTILESTGVPLNPEEENHMPGHSLLQLAHGATPERTIFSEYHAMGALSSFYMVREQHWKYVHYVGYAPQLFDLESDPHEKIDLGTSPAHVDIIDRCEKKLRAVVDPEATSALAFADQAALIERHGGSEAVQQRGDFGYTPAPGEAARFG